MACTSEDSSGVGGRTAVNEATVPEFDVVGSLFEVSEPAPPPPPAVCTQATETFAEPAVDIVFVVDGSGSMGEEWGQIQATMNGFAAQIGQYAIDERVVVISNRICVPAPLGGDGCTSNLPQFMLVPEDVQSNDAFDVTLRSFDKWKSVLRPEALKVFVFVTDDESYFDADNFDRSLLTIAPDLFGTEAQRRYVVHAITGWQPGTAHQSNAMCNTAVAPGIHYQRLADRTGGIVASVCTPSFAPVMDSIANDVVSRTPCSLALPESARADPNQVKVTVSENGGEPQSINRVAGAGECGSSPLAWHYDQESHPTKVILCEGVCTRLKATTSATVDAVLGCMGDSIR